MPFSVGRPVSRFSVWLLIALAACGSGPGGSSTGNPDPGDGFVAVREWAAGERALRLARVEGERFFRLRHGASSTDWISIPSHVRRRDTEKGHDWYFRFENDRGDWLELIVLATGGIEGLDAGSGS